MSGGSGRCPRRVRAGLALAVLALVPGWAPGGLARGQQPTTGEGKSVRDSVRARASRDRVTFIQDPRLAADSTLFPYEWPALDRLRLELTSLRPALEAGAVRELADGLPEVRVRADTLITADTVPALLVSRRAEVRERLAGLGAALRRVQELAPAALAAPPDSSMAEPAGFAPLDDSLDSLGSPDAGARAAPGSPPLAAEAEPGASQNPGLPTALEQPSARESPAGTPPALESPAGAPPAGASPAGWPAERVAPTESPADEAAADSLVELNAVGAFLEAWRDVYAQEEALLHLVRDPFGE